MNRTIILASTVLAIIVGLAYWLATEEQTKPPADGDALVAVLVPELPSKLTTGRDLFDVKCATCHGANAAGKNGKGPPLVHIIYEPNHHPNESFLLAAQNGARAHHWPFGNMPPIEDITESEIAEIIKYIRHLQRANGIGISQ